MFIKEPASDGDEIRSSQAVLGEDWRTVHADVRARWICTWGVAQDVKVERFTMQPEEGPKIGPRHLDLPAFHNRTVKKSTTEPKFRNERSRFRYRLQNFKTEKGDPITVPADCQKNMWTASGSSKRSY